MSDKANQDNIITGRDDESLLLLSVAAAAASSDDYDEEQQQQQQQENAVKAVDEQKLLHFTCPICLHDTNDDDEKNSSSSSNNKRSPPLRFAAGPCQHIFCVPCLERHLLAPTTASSSSSFPRGMSTGLEDSKITTTLNCCPICRAELSWFDVQLLSNGKQEPIYKPAEHSCPFERKGAIYVDAAAGEDGLGKASFHFEPLLPPQQEKSDDNGSSHNNNNNSSNYKLKAFYNVENIPLHLKHPNEPDHYCFDQTWYHAPTRTFMGEIHFAEAATKYPVISRRCKRMRVVLTFSADGKFVTRGVIVRQHKVCDTIQQWQEIFPMDGTWAVVRHNSNNDDDDGDGEEEEEVQVSILRNRVSEQVRGGVVIQYLMRPDNTPIRLTGPLHDENLPVLYGRRRPTQSAGEAVAPSSSLPFKIGDVLEFFVAAATEETMENAAVVETWTRQSVEPTSLDDVPAESVAAIGGHVGRIYKRLNIGGGNDDDDDRDTVTQPPTYHGNTLWGNTFCQGLRVGLASYHFQSPEHVYISYQHPTVGQWPPLDNGIPIPSQVPFHNISIRQTSDGRTIFEGQICWLQDYGTTWQNMTQWDYVMEFDSRFMCIVGGQVHCVWASHHNRQDEEISRYGETLVYCNAALFDFFRADNTGNDDTNSNNNSDGSESSSSFHARSTSLRQRLSQEGASVRTIGLVHKVFTTASQPTATNPIDFNIDDNNHINNNEERRSEGPRH